MQISKLTIKFQIIGVMMLLLATGVFAQKVRYNFLPGTDFSRFKTYKWVRVEKGSYPNDILDEQIRRSIDAELAQKGLTKQDSGIPDLAVVYQVAINKETEWSSFSTGGDYWGWGGWGGWGGMSSTYGSTSTIHIGTLNLDMYDIATKRQIWRGEATKTLDPPKDPAKLQSRIDKAMKKMLKNYPPPVKK